MSSEPAQPGDRPSITERLMFAVPAALFYGTILYFLIWMPSGESLPFLSGLVLFPMAITGTATILADPRGEGSLWRHIKIGWICITLFIVLSMVLMREAGICVVMAAPFFYAGSALGSDVFYASRGISPARLAHPRRSRGALRPGGRRLPPRAQPRFPLRCGSAGAPSRHFVRESVR